MEFLGSSGLEIMTRPIGPQATESSFTITRLNARVDLTGIYQCLSRTTIEGFPPEVVESSPATIIVQGTVRMQYMSHTMDKYS